MRHLNSGPQFNALGVVQVEADEEEWCNLQAFIAIQSSGHLLQRPPHGCPQRILQLLVYLWVHRSCTFTTHRTKLPCG